MEKVSAKAAKEMYEHASKLESEYRHYISGNSYLSSQYSWSKNILCAVKWTLLLHVAGTEVWIETSHFIYIPFCTIYFMFCFSCDPCRCECGIHVHTGQGSCWSGAEENSLGPLRFNLTVSIFPRVCWETWHSNGYAQMAVLIASFTGFSVCSSQTEYLCMGSRFVSSWKKVWKHKFHGGTVSIKLQVQCLKIIQDAGVTEMKDSLAFHTVTAN